MLRTCAYKFLPFGEHLTNPQQLNQFSLNLTPRPVAKIFYTLQCYYRPRKFRIFTQDLPCLSVRAVESESESEGILGGVGVGVGRNF
jgi:hypothetical protein